MEFEVPTPMKKHTQILEEENYEAFIDRLLGRMNVIEQLHIMDKQET
jgi:hypothetical protein